MRPPRREWAVSFGVMAVFAGCVVTATVFTALIFVALLAASAEELSAAGIESSPGRLALLVGGFAALAILVVGPSVAFGVGWLLRSVRNQSLHVVAFALAGAVVGGLVGYWGGGPVMANVLAAMLGASAGIGRLALAPFARV